MEGGYFTDIPPNVVGLKNSFLVGLLSTFVFINFFIIFHKYKQISLIGILCVDCLRQTATGSKLLNFPSKKHGPMCFLFTMYFVHLYTN